MRIRTRLFFLILAMLAPAVICAALGVFYIYHEQREAHRNTLRETARAMSLVVDKEIARREGVLRALAQSPLLDHGDLAAFYALSKRIVPMWESTLVLSDLSGRQFLNTRLPYGSKDMPRSSSTALREQYGPLATVVSNLYMAPIGKQPSFSVQIPVVRDGRVVYYMAMGSFASQLQSVFTEQRLPKGWIGSILDRSGVIVARSRDPEKFVGMRAGEKIYRKIMSSDEGFNEGPTLSGEMVNAFFSRAPQSGWTFVVSVPQDMIQRGAAQATLFLAGVSLMLIGFAVAIAYAVGRSTANAVEALRSSAERLGRGEPIEARPFGILEMDAVNAAMSKAGEEIRTARQELERRVSEAVAVATQSQRALLQAQKLDALGHMTGGIAHDFNNVLQTLTTGLQIAQHQTPDEQVRGTLEACVRAVDRANELTRQLMVFGRVQDARIETVNPAERMRDMLPLLRGGLRSDIDLRLQVEEPLWTVTLDPLQFELALLNLAINARDAMPHSGALVIHARNVRLEQPLGELAAGEYLRLDIVDNGAGMTQEVLTRAIDPFFTTKDVGKGSGMGLAQVYGFAKQSGGSLALESRPGKGTTATIFLPNAGKSAEPHRPPSARRGLSAEGGTVLFVEDDALVREVVTPALRSYGFTVLEAVDAESALALLEQQPDIDLLFSDIVMPGRMSGIDLAEAVRERAGNIRIVLASGYTDRRVTVPGVRMLAKPYAVADIVDILREELKS